jgi:hypothetical protein
MVPTTPNSSAKKQNTTNNNKDEYLSMDKLKQIDLILDESNRNSLNMDDYTNEEAKVCSEFDHLQEKSRQLFNGLRELPQYGHRNNQWQAYFGRTFDVYTKLWKFQQQNRQILENKHNLKRWQIGEIASKIGQLYYHY